MAPEDRAVFQAISKRRVELLLDSRNWLIVVLVVSLRDLEHDRLRGFLAAPNIVAAVFRVSVFISIVL